MEGLKRRIVKIVRCSENMYEPSVVLLCCGHKVEVWNQADTKGSISLNIEVHCKKCLLDALKRSLTKSQK